ncbi:hypothetical protein CEXT_590821 [Caerostris extrusa]|uniref:Uncharacterized protein n=1 Tax=Caerostris extrusa TaxID=172846 RepID=A0AAV4URY2_CAEEX|nr:hypothetical protein CEXT_590821 [Caerostris extrusa]
MGLAISTSTLEGEASRVSKISVLTAIRILPRYMTPSPKPSLSVVCARQKVSSREGNRTGRRRRGRTWEGNLQRQHFVPLKTSLTEQH